MGRKNRNMWIEEIQNVTNTFDVEFPELFYTLDKIAANGENGKLRRIALDLQHCISECIDVCRTINSEIRVSENEYTLHGLQHSFNVLDLMGQLINKKYEISVLEIGFLVYSALLHDIGMIKIGDEQISSENIRKNHGERSAYFIKNNVIKTNSNHDLYFGQYDFLFKKYLPDLCQSHMEDFSFILDFPRNLMVDSCKIDLFFCAVLLRLADAMDMRSNRAPYSLFALLELNDISTYHWKKHMSITNCMVDEDGFFRIDGVCDDEKILRAILQHVEMIEREIRTILVEDSYLLSVRTEIVRNNIQTQGYKVWNNTITLNYYAITKLFMGSQLYGTNKAGLREIMQNAIDACMVRKSIDEKKSVPENYVPQIAITFDDDYIYIKDNGIGMTLDIIEKYFLNVGISYYNTVEFKSKKLCYQPVGYFGIGFLSCFMLSDDILVRTASYSDPNEYRLHFIKGDKYVIIYEKQRTDFVGTEIRFKKEKFLSEFKDLNDSESSTYEVGNIEKYVRYCFWNLILTRRENNFIYRISEKTFNEYSKKQYGRGSRYILDLKKYLHGVEGIIFLNDDSGLAEMWKVSGKKITNFIEALNGGIIEINGDIKKTMPFCENAYVYAGNKLRKVEDHDKFIYSKDYVLGFISFKNESESFSPDFPLFVSREVFEYTVITTRTYEYQRLFGRTSTSLLRRNITDKLFEHFNKEYHHIHFLLPNSNSPYDTLINERLEEKKDRDMIELYLKSTRINAFDIKKNWLLFDVKKIMLNVTNERIQPQASRSDLVEKSVKYLENAVEVVKYLWLIEELQKESFNAGTVKYLKECVLDIWDSSNPLLRKEFKP